jgi:hypothetical protein
MGSVKWAMASLFVLVGLFVCYSAVSRLVHEQMTQIGTKKALGFRKSEIAQGYLAFSGLAVALGILLSLLIAVFLVQLIMNPIVIKQFAMMPYGPHVSVLDLLVVGCIELVLILASTWFAISGMLKLEATELLRGETTANVREHFYERTLLWKHMSLFSQTVVNNCVNDKRRVAGTLVGVVGCTALIVTAMTLATDVALSLDLHYEEVYSFDSIAYMDEEGDGAVKQAAMALYDHGVMSSPAFMRSVQMTQSDGTRNVTTLVVPGFSDGETQIAAASEWLASLDTDITYHLTRFFPQYRMRDVPPTPLSTLRRLETVAHRHLAHVLLGNV